MTRLEISRSVLEAIRSHAAADPDHEVCGLLFGSETAIDAAAPARNLASDPARRFEVDPAALFKAIRAERAGGPRLIGYYHSHPRGPATPSGTDMAMAGGDGKLWLIHGEDALTAWRSTPVGFQPVVLSYLGNES